MDNLLAGVEAGKGNIGMLLKDEELYDRLNGIASEGQKLLADVRTGNGTISKLIYDDALYKEIRAPLERIDAMLADLQAGQGTAGKLLKDPALYDDAQQTLAEIRGLVADLNAGKGTAGKLLKDDAAATSRLDALMARFNTTMDKINSGQGTLGQLVVNPQLYESLNGVTREFQSLAKDMRANPKKFLTHQADPVLSGRKRLVVNADDFGFTPDVNEGIVEAHRRRHPDRDHADGQRRRLRRRGAAGAARRRAWTSAATWCWSAGGSLLTARSAAGDGGATAGGAGAAARSGRTRSWRRRCGGFWTAGIRPTHLDTHKHTHLAPPVLDAVARLARRVRHPLGAAPVRFSAERACAARCRG